MTFVPPPLPRHLPLQTFSSSDICPPDFQPSTQFKFKFLRWNVEGVKFYRGGGGCWLRMEAYIIQSVLVFWFWNTYISFEIRLPNKDKYLSWNQYSNKYLNLIPIILFTTKTCTSDHVKNFKCNFFMLFVKNLDFNCNKWRKSRLKIWYNLKTGSKEKKIAFKKRIGAGGGRLLS